MIFWITEKPKTYLFNLFSNETLSKNWFLEVKIRFADNPKKSLQGI